MYWDTLQRWPCKPGLSPGTGLLCAQPPCLTLLSSFCYIFCASHFSALQVRNIFLYVACSPCTGSPVLVSTGPLELFGEGLCTPALPPFSLQADIVFSCWESTVPCLAVYMVNLYCKSEV